MHRVQQDLRRPEAAPARHRRALHHLARRDGAGAPRLRGRHRAHRARSPSSATSSCRSARPSCPRFALPEGISEDDFIGEARPRGARPALPGDRRASTRTTATPTAQRLEMELGVIQKMGFSGYFLIVQDFINWAKERERAGGPGPRLGRRLDRGLVAAHHRPRPHPLEPALRALPQPRARVDAGLRHRLLPEPARRGDPLRRRQVRQGQRRADHHLRLAQGALGASATSCGSWGSPSPRATASPSSSRTRCRARRRRSRSASRTSRASRSSTSSPTEISRFTDGKGAAAGGHHQGPPRHRHGARGAEPPGRACTPPASSSPTSRSGSTSRSTRTTSPRCSSRSSRRTRSRRPGS